ncbi:hypothetical protein RclHR1_05900006 [Rhizophagus clarus]|uniref:Galactose oxidase n=1 Tax=Rhizophagus clarus TaxID=94130 RepID=A0A2Z6SHA2_9GLOM|nr:hypothetical protein RclHR1_05900006 [Rhizophagus clarus]
MGGTSSGSNLRDFIYLDFSESFNTRHLTWNRISSDFLPENTGSISVKGGKDNDTIFFFAGRSPNENSRLVYEFGPQTNSWRISPLQLNITINTGSTGVVDNKGRMYSWAGYYPPRNMLILDTIEFNWKFGNIISAPTLEAWYGASLLPDQMIIYIGGYQDGAINTLDQVYIYNTIKDTWSNITTSGNIPSPRMGLSAVLGLDGRRIIIFGGENEYDFIPANESLYVLNLVNFEWYIPTISGKIPESRISHKGDVIGEYMVITFGRSFPIGRGNYNSTTESHILLLNISNNEEYYWTDNFEPSSPPLLPPPSKSLPPGISSTEFPPPKHSVSSGNGSVTINRSIISIIVVSLIGIALLLFGLCKWNKSRKSRVNTSSIPHGCGIN